MRILLIKDEMTLHCYVFGRLKQSEIDSYLNSDNSIRL